MGKVMRREELIGRVTAVLIFTIILFIVISSILIYKDIKVEAALEKESYKYYTQVVVSYGETMEDIAKEYMSEEFGSIEKYIEEVCSINSFYGERLSPGSYLIVPYYDVILK